MNNTQANTYKVHVFPESAEEKASATGTCPRPKWQRYYGRGEVDRRTGRRGATDLYLGFADGSRLRIVRGGAVKVLA